ncbi:polyadenylate-binding protein-interacting protein 2-like [Dunckerocampus dactyliophorus]|uniref:polyadenylate-binding protein-interacting protein 2-like n=1 Tax=Dunckerocampus dactyliophorus TaxID=161453 RepID=UPI002405DC61|nr:polyadenylate-binding protein-interacting protein 2-like [Dunckerocampus dactyliophorus]
MKDPRLSHVTSNMTLSNDVTLSSLQENPFAEYMWMEHEEEFNRQVEEELWEEDFMERCFQEMLDEEEWEWFVPSRDLPPGNQRQEQYHSLSATSSSLNPNAKEFTPGIQKHIM